LRRAFRAGDLPRVERVASGVGVSPSAVDAWRRACRLAGVGGLRGRGRGGRPPKRTESRRQRLAELVTAGPEAAGFPTGGWHAPLIRQVIAREFGVSYNVHCRATLLPAPGFSFRRARFVSDHPDAVQRAARRAHTFPAWRAQAEAAGGLRLFGDEARFARWGSLGYPWAPIGQRPVVETTGIREASKVFGLIEFFSGRRFYRGIAGEFNGDSHAAFLSGVLEQTPAPLFPVRDGAPDHRGAPATALFAQHRARLHVTRLPSYSPDSNPIECLWRATRRTATHNRDCPAFAELCASVEEALALFSRRPERVKGRFGRYLDEMAAEPAEPAAVAQAA
jgi:transposase